MKGQSNITKLNEWMVNNFISIQTFLSGVHVVIPEMEPKSLSNKREEYTGKKLYKIYSNIQLISSSVVQKYHNPNFIVEYYPHPPSRRWLYNKNVNFVYAISRFTCNDKL